MNFFRRASMRFAEFFGETTDFDKMGENPPCSDPLNSDYLSDLLPFRLYDPQRKIYENKKSFGFAIEVIPVLGGAAETRKELASLIKELGEEGANIQNFFFADHRIERFLQIWAEPRRKAGGIFSKIAERKMDFLHQQLAGGEIPPRVFRFFFSFSLPKPHPRDLETVLNRLVEKRKKATETFSRISIASEIEPDQLIEMFSGIVNFDLCDDGVSRRRWDTKNWISKQICLPGSALEIFPDGILFHGRQNAFLKTYEAVDFPDFWQLSQMGELAGDFLNGSYRIPSPFYIHYGIYFPSQPKMENKTRGKFKLLAHQSKFPSLAKMLPGMHREMEEHFFVQKQLMDGELFVETRLNVGLWAAQERFVKAESTLLALFQKYGFKLRENRFVHLPDFLSSLPMAWGDDSCHIAGLKRTRCIRTTLTSETAHLIPIIGEWWGNANQGMILMGRRGQFATWDPFATDGNPNTVVVGPSGSGKSVFMQEMILSHLGQGGRVFVLDLGRSFEKLCALLGGKNLTFSEKTELDLNPFRLIRTEGGVETVNAGLEMVSSIVATMAAPLQKIDKERFDILGSLVKTAWEREGNLATIDTLITLLDQMQFHSQLMIGASESLKEGLKKYGRQGVFSGYFYGSNRVDFSSDFLVIETEELKNMADLQAVVLQIFASTISNQIFMGDRKRRCLICIDEAWDLLKSPQMEGFIETLARRLRKYNGALVVGTQSILDFDRSFGARAAFQNSNWLVMLGKDSDSVNALKKNHLIPMSEYKEAALLSLRMESGKYSECFIYHKGSGSFSINQLKLDPYSSLLYSTQVDEFQAMHELKLRGLCTEKALEWFFLHRSELKKRLAKGQTVQDAIESLWEKS